MIASVYRTNPEMVSTREDPQSSVSNPDRDAGACCRGLKQLLELYSGNLKRSHGLLKRLVRLSQIWLNEFTTMESFLEKGKTVLWKFLVRKAKSFAGLS